VAKILLVEDDSNVADAVQEVLRFEGYIVDTVDNGKDAIYRLKYHSYDVMIIDWGLPDMSGIEVCAQYRQTGGNLPIIMLTGRGGIDDKVIGLDYGADDYLTKPFDSDELTARVRAILRRPRAMISTVLEAHGVQLNTASQTVTINNEPVVLQAQEFALLECLLRHKNQVLSIESLIDKVWSTDSEVSPDAVRQCVTRLRKKLDKSLAPVITTVVGLGYSVKD
jgi:two-component system OmpR family response regulator